MTHSVVGPSVYALLVQGDRGRPVGWFWIALSGDVGDNCEPKPVALPKALHVIWLDPIWTLKANVRRTGPQVDPAWTLLPRW